MFKHNLVRNAVIYLSLISIILLPPAFGEIYIDINVKDSFSLGEKISFSYTISSDYNIEEVRYIPHIQCKSLPVPLLIEKEIDLIKGIIYEDSFNAIIVDESIEPQTCTAYIEMLSPEERTVYKSFKIITDPSFSFWLKTCNDYSCIQQSSIFVKDSSIYLDYESDVDNPAIDATLVKPDGSANKITIPSSFVVDQIGSYIIEYTASKEGYKTIENILEFGVIEKEFSLGSIPSGSPSPSPSSYGTGAVILELLEGNNLVYALLFIVIIIIIVILSKKKILT